MSATPIIDVCKAVLTALEGNTAFDDATRTRALTVSKAIKEVKATLALVVVPLNTVRTRVKRQGIDRTIQVGVAVLKKIKPGSLTEADALAEIAEDVAQFFDPEDGDPLELPAPAEDAAFLSVTIEAPYVSEMIDADHTFVCPITLTYLWRT